VALENFRYAALRASAAPGTALCAGADRWRVPSVKQAAPDAGGREQGKV